MTLFIPQPRATLFSSDFHPNSTVSSLQPTYCQPEKHSTWASGNFGVGEELPRVGGSPSHNCNGGDFGQMKFLSANNSRPKGM